MCKVTDTQVICHIFCSLYNVSMVDFETSPLFNQQAQSISFVWLFVQGDILTNYKINTCCAPEYLSPITINNDIEPAYSIKLILHIIERNAHM